MLHIAALYGNTNLDLEDNDRPRRVREWERAYDNLIAQIWNGETIGAGESAQEQALMSSDFMRASSRNAPALPGSGALAGLG